jgi:2-polyprenyl-3-methyl-5-hydroxy-6-metoxy-1,4-benzoquinol methylase
MTATIQQTAAETIAGGLVEQLFGAAVGAFEFGPIYLGVRLGLYEALADDAHSAVTLARAAGIDQRYAEEWLEQQAIAGYVDVVTSGPRDSRTYQLSAGQALVLAAPDSPFYGGHMSRLVVSIGAVLPQLMVAFRTGGGIPFGAYGDDVRAGQGLFNKFALLNQLAADWVAPLGIDSLLSAQGATAVDLGCGVGWSGIALAQAYPDLLVTGIDSDEASILDARRNAAEAGVGHRARFETLASDGAIGGPYDVAFYFESLHDMAHPVESLAAVRAALKPGGAVVVMDEKAEEEFAPCGSAIERIYAASSVMHCLPVGLSEADSAGTGALLRPSTLRTYARQAGFTSVEVAPIEHDFFRFYRIR